MKVLVSGGGTAGHVTPTLAVIAELKKLDPKAEIVYIAQKGDASVGIVKKRAPKVRLHYIQAGKLRRFHAYSKIKQLINLPLVARNIRDFGKFGVGVMQAWKILGREKPDVVFIKGGYVGLPVGIAAKRRGVPIVTHDSDALPGLTNRLLSRWSTYCAVTMPKQYYNYPDAKMVETGLPISAEFASVAHAPQHSMRTELGLPARIPCILVAAGSSGAQRINDAMVSIIPELYKKTACTIVHITGEKHLESVRSQYETAGIDMKNVRLLAFVHNLHEYTRAADIVITRAGSMMIELAAQRCAVISIPSPYLTGGHQLKNGEMYASASAAIVLDEFKVVDDPNVLLASVDRLLGSREKRQKMGEALHEFYTPNAAKSIAELLIRVSQEKA